MRTVELNDIETGVTAADANQVHGGKARLQLLGTIPISGKYDA